MHAAGRTRRVPGEGGAAGGLRPPQVLSVPLDGAIKSSTNRRIRRTRSLKSSSLAPGEDRGRKPLTRGVQGVRHLPPLVGDHRLHGCDDRLGSVDVRSAPGSELCHLAADGRVVAPGSVRKLDHADRPEALDPHQQPKEGLIQGDACLREQRLIALRLVHERGQIDHGSVELAELAELFCNPCILHKFP